MAIVQSSGERLSPAEARRLMVDRQVRTFDVTDQVVTSRMLDVPRDMFVGEAQHPLAYSDLPLDLAGSGGVRARVLLPPFVVARMMQAAGPRPTDRVLDIAGGTGYSAALFAGLVAEVFAVESDSDLSAKASRNFATLGLSNARAIEAPLASGGRGLEPFDVIFVNGCAEDGLAVLASLLAPTGRIVAIVPKPSGATMAAKIAGRGNDLSVRPLFDAQAPVLDEFRRAVAFVL